MNNIVEGYEAGGNVMFKKFLQISRGCLLYTSDAADD